MRDRMALFSDALGLPGANSVREPGSDFVVPSVRWSNGPARRGGFLHALVLLSGRVAARLRPAWVQEQTMADSETERESLKDEMRNVLEEARMVIPGIQALFGFQTMAVFNNRFEELPPAAVACYLAGLALLALSIALLMTPAAYNRIAERGQVSRRMIDLSSRLITAGLVPLMCSLALDVYVVCVAAVDDSRLGLAAAVAALVVFSAFWFAFPLRQYRRLRRHRPTVDSARA